MNSKKKVFLIVDDDTDDQDFFREVIHEVDSSAECYLAFNGEDALQKLRDAMHQLPDFIFLDINMPRLDGWQCLAELKKEKRLKNIPVIIISTSSFQRDIDKAKQLGAVYYLTKPTDAKTLQKEIFYIMKTDWKHSFDVKDFT